MSVPGVHDVLNAYRVSCQKYFSRFTYDQVMADDLCMDLQSMEQAFLDDVERATGKKGHVGLLHELIREVCRQPTMHERRQLEYGGDSDYDNNNNPQ